MQFNCILFPGKSACDISQIQDRITLIPQNTEQHHIYYQSYINPRFKPIDFLTIIAKQSQKPLQKQLKTQCRTTINTQQSFGINTQQNKYSNKHCQNQQQFIKISDSDQQTSSKKYSDKYSSNISNKQIIKVTGFIPCMFVPGNQKLIVYLHGNAEDLVSTSDFINFINNKMGYSIIVMEYPGYSVYDGSSNAEKIEDDCLWMMSYLMRIGFVLDNIFVIGRSIGTGPALFLSSYYKVKGLMLISPFLSISTLVRDKFGVLPSMLVKQRFENYKVIQQVSVPIFILHGLEDSIVPYNHSYKLQQLAGGKCYIKLIEKMTHGAFDFKNDFLEPLKSFIEVIKF